MTPAHPSPVQSALERLANAVDDLKAGDPLRPVTVLAPSTPAAVTARRHLASHGGVAAVNVTALARYADLLAAPLLAPQRPATRAVVASAWRQALGREPGPFAEVADHPSTVAALTRAYRDLRDLDAAALDLVSTLALPAPDLVRLQREVEATLSSSWYDEVDLLWAAADAADAGNEPVIVYLSGRFTPSEHRFLEALQTARTVVTVDVEHPAPRATRVIHASDADDEVRAVVRDLMTNLEQGRTAVVLYADPRPYTRLLAEQLTSAGIAYNGPGARPVAERAVVRTFLGLLDLARADLPRAALFDALGGAAVRDLDGELVPTARWERHSRAAGVVRGDHWDQRLRTWIDDEAPEWEKESGHRLHAFAGELRRQLSQTHGTWADMIDWALGLYAALLVDQDRLRRLPPEEQHAHTTLQLSLRGLVVLDDTTTPPSVGALHELLSVDLEASIPRVGRFGDGVYVGPIATGAGLSADVTYVLGLSEDLYPGTPREDVLLPDRIRARLDGALPSLRDRIDDKRRALDAAFSTAPEVVATFPRGDLRQTKGRLPSRWLLPTLRHLAGDPELSATQWETATYAEHVWAVGSFAGELLTSGRLATEQEWRIRAAVAGVLTDVVVESAGEVLRARDGSDFTRFDGNLAGLDGLSDLRLGEEAISPTALEKYAACPHSYFVERMLGVRPVENPEDVVTIPAAELGTFIHTCMDELTKRGGLPSSGEPWTAEHQLALREIAERNAAALEQRGVTGHQRLWAVEKERVLITLAAMLDEDSAWRAGNASAVTAAELEFGLNGKPPIEIAVPGGTILMRGSADKIDVAAGRIYVTDIKSGRRSGYSSIKQADPAPYGSKLQLPAYAYAALAVLDLDLPVTAGYWFVHKDTGRVDLEFDDDVRDHYGRVLAVLAAGIAGGLYPARPPTGDDFAFTQCAFCNPDGVGYAGRRREWTSKAAHPDLATLVSLIVDNEVPHD
ncbi:PD-(D/E)XK nuclease family protein [Nocardioides sp. ChNu-153]|uniref:PD-(D/E)XK nuclease family protein n=1 Tax=Nocardioides sp. ChNu-153 TaxID=2779364 RepID=UPI002658855C|nr:PD-(D/E)XK nuclease family protein [Nocardioides sp. ChNu-153]